MKRLFSMVFCTLVLGVIVFGPVTEYAHAHGVVQAASAAANFLGSWGGAGSRGQLRVARGSHGRAGRRLSGQSAAIC